MSKNTNETNKIIKKINELTRTYQTLKNIAFENFNHLKINNFNGQKEREKKQSKTFSSMLKQKKELKKALDEEAVKIGRETLKIREYMEVIKEDDKEILDKSIKDMLIMEQEFRKQLSMNIEMAVAMKEVHNTKLEAVVEIIQREKQGQGGSLLIDQDF